MFENDDDIDLDDEFLNVVFEQEAGDKGTEKSAQSTRPSVESKTPEVSSYHDLNNEIPISSRPTDKLFHAKSSTDNENHFPQLSHNNRPFHQSGNSNVGDKENKRKASSPPRSKRERKFPGPAGLLPDRKSIRGTPLKLDKLSEVESPSASSPDELCSQGRLSGSVLEEGPWQSLVSDLGPHAAVLDTVNVASVKRKAAARCFVGRKVPFLAAVLHHIDVSSADPCIILRDSTGEIHGTLHRDVWQQFAPELVVGSVLVVRNVGLLSTGISSRRHYLNITANNLATIYSASPDKVQKRELHSFTPQDYMKTVEVWQTLVAPPRNSMSPASSLFGNVSLSSSSSSPAQSPQTNGFQPNPSNVRQSTSQNMNWTPRATLPLRPMGKNLFPPNINSNNPTLQSINRNKISLPSTSRNPCSSSLPSTSGVVKQTNPVLGINTFHNPPHSEQKSLLSINKNPHLTKTPDTFNFDPVMLKTKTFNGAVSSPQNFLVQPTFRNDNRNNPSRPNTSHTIILSQSSQLTAEEQSVVDSVFDGIDADSLFDDDF